ncbi:MAG: hypothetical protein LH613_13400 [Chamaesiphon sp.]|nr:hypothetical protein [Chamaesiphon sp.]
MAFPRLALEKNTYPSRRNLLKLGLMVGTIALTAVPQVLMAQTSISIKKLTFNADDIGILNRVVSHSAYGQPPVARAKP